MVAALVFEYYEIEEFIREDDNILRKDLMEYDGEISNDTCRFFNISAHDSIDHQTLEKFRSGEHIEYSLRDLLVYLKTQGLIKPGNIVIRFSW